MRRLPVVLSLLVISAAASCSAQNPARPAGVNPWKDQALVFQQLDTSYRMRADGTGEREMHALIRLQSAGAAQQFGVLSFTYASAQETPVIKLVRVHKPDGTTVDTPPSNAIDMTAAVSREAPLYSDLKEKHLPVRSLAVGDTLEYDVVIQINKAEAPGEFWGSYHFTPPGTIIVQSESLTLQVPSGKYVQVRSPNHKPVVTDHDDSRTYVWSQPQLVPAPKSTGNGPKPPPPLDVDENTDGLKLPSVAWTTFRSWAEIGQWYGNLAFPQSKPTDAIRARAEDLTRSSKTPDAQIRAIYDFVSTQIRYVGIDFGVGRYRPHTAAEVLADRYGDCKDKDTLLEALLQAKGFSTAPALIGAGIAPVADVPSPSTFNHVITTVNLPQGRLWLDSTPMVAPYGFLASLTRNQAALVVPGSGMAQLVTTPASGPFPYTENFQAVATLDSEGKLTGKITSAYHDDNELLIRALARAVAPADWDKASQYISSATGFGGNTSNTQFEHIDDDGSPIVLTYDYSRHPFGDWDNRRIVPLFPALELPSLGEDATEPTSDIQLGAPRTLTAVSRIHLPVDFHVDVPDPIHVATDFADFDKTYSFENQTLVVKRILVIKQKKLPRSQWKQYQAFTRQIGLSGEPWIQLIAQQKPLVLPDRNPFPNASLQPKSAAKSADDHSTIVHATSSMQLPAPAGPLELTGNETALQLMQMAQTLLRTGDYGGAKELLDKAKAKNPQELNLWTMYGVIEQLQRNDATAVSDYRKELSYHPDNSYAVGSLAGVQARDGDSLGARQTLSGFLQRYPANPKLAQYLASLQQSAGDNAGALKTLQEASEKKPDDLSIRLQITNVLLQLHRDQEAAASAKSILGVTTDPSLLNDAAYMLGETGQDLSTAEQASRKSVATLEQDSLVITAAEANSGAFARAHLLVAAWDTLGWILYREGNLAAARSFLTAAWRASLTAEVGYHLAQLQEAESHRRLALTTYELARSAMNRTTTPEVRGKILDSIARLRTTGLQPLAPTDKDALQNLRTFKVARPKAINGWATYRLDITTGGIGDSVWVSGQKQMTALQPAINTIKIPSMVPAGSHARLLQSAVVSCTSGNTCDVVLVPGGGLQTEIQ